MSVRSSLLAPVRSSDPRRDSGALRMIAACGLAFALATAALVAQQPKAAQGVSPKQRQSLVKLAEPWPDEATIAKRKADADKRRLFQSADPITFTLAADFKKVTSDRSPTSKTLYPAKLTVAGEDGQPVTLDVSVRNRGILRRNPRTCGFPPIKIVFPQEEKAETKKTPFAGSKELKLATHCSGDYEQYVVKEYLAYKSHNLITPWSLRVRLAKGTYIESTNGKTIATKLAFFIEAEEDLAKRMEGRVAVLPRTTFADHDMDALTQAALFSFMVGNTDYSIFVLHNTFLIQTRDKKLHTVVYDFDVTGLVNPPYALPARDFHIASVKDRVYRGPCRPAEQLEPLLAVYRAKKDDILRLYTNQPELNKGSRDEMKDYIEEFYSIINDKGRIKRWLVDTCNKGVW